MPLPLELGQVEDAHARRALEQVSLRWPSSLIVPIVNRLPAMGAPGQLVFNTTDMALYLFYIQWRKV